MTYGTLRRVSLLLWVCFAVGAALLASPTPHGFNVHGLGSISLLSAILFFGVWLGLLLGHDAKAR